MKYLITFVFLLFVSIASANTPIQSPDWVLGKGHPSFPDSKYLIGVGVSEKSTVSASESARVELIKTIRVQVNSVSKDYISREKSVSESSIVSETDFLLEGSQVKDGWYDARNNLFYSLVIIERQYVLETLKMMIEHILASIELSLRQADTFFNNGEIIRALVYYYNGYKESSKLLPYIQTYNSVILVKDSQEYKDEYNLLFKEKIQNIVDNIYLEKQTEIINNNNLDLNIKASFKGRGIKNFPIKFSSGYNHYVERVLCGSDGYCKINLKVEKIVNKNNDILITAVVDLQTLEKHFNHSLKKNLFGRLELLSITFKLKREIQVVQMIKQEKKKYRRSIGRHSGDIDLSPLRNGFFIDNYKARKHTGHINFRFRFGNGSNINIHKGW